MNQAIERINEEKIVAIVRLDSIEHVDRLAQSLYEGGIRVIEITLNTPGALEGMKKIKQRYDDFLVGAGTVLDGENARSAIEAGADFLLAPTLSKETIQVGNRYGVPVIPGVMTPTEALTAYEWGARLVKVFPARSVGESFAKDLKGPLPFLSVMAVGGVSLDNVSDYFQAGWHSVGIGSSLVSNDADFDEIKAKAMNFITKRDEIAIKQ
ncbi:2-dehydro-3-deoxyphosphogluconate aldolase / (4S)-4-hydroxy-2-oxoglutarate aldolase [Halobacillus karajensis]|uniref:KHG/KDPG aldolase n=1 Tax=Halobacillus karajensis TaxID=195088 RepID=A0A024P3B3_9BACI|nr:bifunctional 4-hydroxy-2-oxoglutarate aldolase/2-dehydro-3-deoxy-phosphogluconate aldolase [Halobacillus karajensis]CDQ19082.1 KHG/KDPG aldolase [Halobacillus karajensis]CDQ22844.1 KHG/KDPG aldolase [Halobacillus karajensis]CDQ26326.1 KHG/KDPG aldolase [Halobacillus karajensis]SEH41906.1 2-dehydro-3-deoxyphosphogluconate aldolase / (4S)-4-hydroxy-2-oxoglutarate aldolase [Halobacillus karajensis]